MNATSKRATCASGVHHAARFGAKRCVGRYCGGGAAARDRRRLHRRRRAAGGTHLVVVKWRAVSVVAYRASASTQSIRVAFVDAELTARQLSCRAVRGLAEDRDRMAKRACRRRAQYGRYDRFDQSADRSCQSSHRASPLAADGRRCRRRRRDLAGAVETSLAAGWDAAPRPPAASPPAHGRRRDAVPAAGQRRLRRRHRQRSSIKALHARWAGIRSAHPQLLRRLTRRWWRSGKIRDPIGPSCGWSSGRLPMPKRRHNCARRCWRFRLSCQPTMFDGRTSRSSDRRVMMSGDKADRTMRRPLFLPTARQTNWLLIIAFLSLGEALYLRYHGDREQHRVARLPRRARHLAVRERFGWRSCFSTMRFWRGRARGGIAQSAAAVARAVRRRARGGGFRRGAAQRRPVRARSRRAHPELGASRASARMTARPISPAQNQTACQLAKPSLNTT